MNFTILLLSLSMQMGNSLRAKFTTGMMFLASSESDCSLEQLTATGTILGNFGALRFFSSFGHTRSYVCDLSNARDDLFQSYAKVRLKNLELKIGRMVEIFGFFEPFNLLNLNKMSLLPFRKVKGEDGVVSKVEWNDLRFKMFFKKKSRVSVEGELRRDWANYTAGAYFRFRNSNALGFYWGYFGTFTAKATVLWADGLAAHLQAEFNLDDGDVLSVHLFRSSKGITLSPSMDMPRSFLALEFRKESEFFDSFRTFMVVGAGRLSAHWFIRSILSDKALVFSGLGISRKMRTGEVRGTLYLGTKIIFGF